MIGHEQFNNVKYGFTVRYINITEKECVQTVGGPLRWGGVGW